MNVYLMSKCPDAARAMRDLSAVYYDNSKVLDLRFDYIGELNNKTKYGVICAHGDTECFGNIQHLCVQKKAGTDKALEFMLCQQRNINRIGTYIQLAECLNNSSYWIPSVRCAFGEEV
ncbi:hypothetical protein BX661DRAFT_168315 [Kickxella alabastrina]|uniref:uncharacterized protein n=1 Tax=Kickxella alabastrina TaxID=61397 RepID=UPI002220C0BF|nr:uncharacterized protein BX661DRAFT_168315 [Kickxella alabastrina]KAI7835153.1 hypothetical protein BX661DRAFT_168315 [Kickxella alabastrina]